MIPRYNVHDLPIIYENNNMKAQFLQIKIFIKVDEITNDVNGHDYVWSFGAFSYLSHALVNQTQKYNSMIDSQVSNCYSNSYTKLNISTSNQDSHFH